MWMMKRSILIMSKALRKEAMTHIASPHRYWRATQIVNTIGWLLDIVMPSMARQGIPSQILRNARRRYLGLSRERDTEPGVTPYESF